MNHVKTVYSLVDYKLKELDQTAKLNDKFEKNWIDHKGFLDTMKSFNLWNMWILLAVVNYAKDIENIVK